ncbi:MAG: hypothetical protein JRI68_21140 [Deltaproteobacteria bacterium]|nr:hypothetical protein [Deltaproteobacteria bacterium]
MRSSATVDRLGWALAVGLALWCGASPAGADQRTIAEKLFRDGRELIHQGAIDEACDKFAASMRAEPSVGAHVNLARCRELQGRTATAHREYLAAAALADREGQGDRATAARQLAAKLEAKLSTLTITVTTPVPGLAVLDGGVAVADDRWGVATPVDPGDHHVEASAPGYASFATTVTVDADGDRRTVLVPMLQSGEPETETETETETNSTISTLGWIATGVGAATALSGAILGATVLEDAAEAEDDPSLCPDKICTPAGDVYLADLDGRAAAATALVVVGSVLVVGGIVTVIAAPAADEPDDVPIDVEVGVVAAPGLFAFGARARF